MVFLTDAARIVLARSGLSLAVVRRLRRSTVAQMAVAEAAGKAHGHSARCCMGDE